jgi:hypothetical protein
MEKKGDKWVVVVDTTKPGHEDLVKILRMWRP